MSENEKTEQDQIEELAPTAPIKTWVVGPDDDRREFVQKQLAFHKKVRFLALLGQTTRQVTMVGGKGALGDLLQGESIAEAGRQMASRDMEDAEAFINLASSLLAFVPDFLLDFQCLAWNVGIQDEEWVKTQLEKTEEEGGLTDDQHVETITLFIKQNWPAIKRFFGVLAPEIVKTIREQQSKEEKKDETEVQADE